MTTHLTLLFQYLNRSMAQEKTKSASLQRKLGNKIGDCDLQLAIDDIMDKGKAEKLSD